MIVQIRATIILTLACILGSLSIMPAIVAARARIHDAQIPGWELYGSAVLQSILLFGPAAFLGLWAARNMKLVGAPLIIQWAGGPKAGPLGKGLMLALCFGILGGVALVLIDVFVFQPHPAALRSNVTSALLNGSFWQGLAGGVFYGGINEEVLMRLFLVSALIWAISRLFGPDAASQRGVVLAIIVIAALVFGIAHLPITATMTDLTALIVTRALVLNGIVGIIAGMIYIRYGFEAAVLSHAAAHIPIQTGAALLI